MLERFIIILMTFQIQLISTSVIPFLVYCLCLGGLYLLHRNYHGPDSIFMRNKLVFLVLFSFGFILVAPTIEDFLLLFGIIGLFTA